MKKTLAILLAILIFSSGILQPAFADKQNHGNEKRESKHHFREKEDKEKKGHELSGIIAAGFFVAANAAAVIGIVVRVLIRSTVIGQSAKDGASALIRFQQRYIRTYHYILNLLAAGVALLHWFLSKCSSLPLQQWGTAMAILWVISGVILKYRLVRQSLHRRLFQIHTSLYLPLALVSLIFLGHILMDD